MESTIKTISIETLAEKINGKLWVKGDLKRIYLDKGYNTKKMSTKTYIYEQDGQFKISCYIECPSQPYQWIKSQQDEIKESVECRINEIIQEENSTEIFVIVDENGNFLNSVNNQVNINELNSDDYFFTEEKAIENLNINTAEMIAKLSIRKFSREDFEKERSEFQAAIDTELQNEGK